MPTYDYKCNECGEVFEHFQSIKSEPLKVCNCGKNGSVTRQISHGAGIIFKGSGFYVNDYKKKDAPASETPAASKTSSDTSSKTSTPSKSES